MAIVKFSSSASSVSRFVVLPSGDYDPQWVYNKVSTEESLRTRFNYGGCGKIELHSMGAEGQPLVIKTDKGDWLVDLIPREFEIHSYLTLEGCESVPPLDETLSNESQLVMPLIDSAATLEDYLLDVATGELSIEVAIDILEAVRIALEDFYSYGIIHGDLHCRNILIGLQDGGWRAYIIDVGLSVLLNWEVHPEWAGWHDPEEWSHWMCGAYYPSLEGDWSKLIPPIQNILSDISEPALRAQLSHLEEVFE